jgi:predicted NBD/HSP70 family sugar kinase
MVGENGRYVGIDISKRTREMAIITRTGKIKTTGRGEKKAEEKTVLYTGTTMAEGG